MRPAPLPPGVGPEWFSTAQARDAGLPASRLRRSDLVHPTRGVHAPVPPQGLLDRAHAFAVGMPEERAFSHLTAAVLLGLPLPTALETAAISGPLHVMSSTPEGQARRTGCCGHRGLESRATTVVDGIRVVALADTWCDLAELGRRRITSDDLVVAGDAAVNLLPARDGVPVTWPLRGALEARVRPRGKVMAAEALLRVRAGVRSPMESRARLVVVHAGLPEPEVNAPVTDRAGEWLAEGDLVWQDQRVVGEYQGEVHADRQRRSLDAARRDVLEDEGWTVVELWAESLHQRARRIGTLTRLARALEIDPRTLRIT